MVLGGTRTDPADAANMAFPGSGIAATPGPAWITANELQGKVHNPNLILAVAGCRVGKTNRLWQAVGGRHFVGSTADITSGGVKDIFQYVVDLVTGGQDTAAQSLLRRNSTYVVDPQNATF
jgi:hypothetical protein